jgi:hypothetical protein
VAHAFKHVAVGKRDNPDLQAKGVISRQGPFQRDAFQTNAFDGGSVTLKDDTSVNILEVLKRTAEFLRRQLTMPNA